MKIWKHKEWIEGSVLERGIYWRNADGQNHAIVARGNTRYGLRGGDNGSIWVIGEDSGHAYREGAGRGRACRFGKGPGHAARRGDGPGDAIRSGKGFGHAILCGANGGTPTHCGPGKGLAICWEPELWDIVASKL